MTYHTNHCWCSESMYNDKSFNGEVMVVVSDKMRDMDVLRDNNLYNIKDIDWDNIVDKIPFHDTAEYNRIYKVILDRYTRRNIEYTEEEVIEEALERSNSETVVLKKEVAEWLNINIKDNFIDVDENTPLEDRKAWAIGSRAYNAKENNEITIFFARQLDALNFIEKRSYFKKPTFYFDYFHDERREIEIQEYVKITNSIFKKRNIEELDILNNLIISKGINNNLSIDTFQLIDWEVENA